MGRLVVAGSMGCELALDSIAAKEFLPTFLAGVSRDKVAQSGAIVTMRLSCRLSMGGMLEILFWFICARHRS